MGLKELEAALRSDAAKVVAKILSEAAATAKEIGNVASARLEELDEHERKISEMIKLREEDVLRDKAARLERAMLTMMENMYVSAVRERCKVMYKDFMAGREYAKFIEAEYQLAVSELGDKVRIMADAQTKGILINISGTNAVFIEGTVQNGFVVSSEDGSEEIRCTFESRYEIAWNHLAPRFMTKIAEEVRREP